MNLKRTFGISALLLATVALAYFTIGGLYVYKISQREETRHDKAVANSEPQSYAEWLALTNDQPFVEWSYRNANRQTYLVHLYEDRGFVSSVYRSLRSGQPARFVKGKVDRADWRRLQDLSESMYAQYRELVDYNDRNTDNVQLTIAHGNGHRITYSYNSEDYEQLPHLLREFDTRLFEAMESWAVKPHHGYAKPRLEIGYGPDDLNNLVRGLRSEREELHASVVARMVGVGRSALPALTEVLRGGADVRYLPTSRYAAVLDGLSTLGDASDESFAVIAALAEAPAAIPRHRELKKQAQGIVDGFEIDAYLDQRWAVSAEAQDRFRQTDLSPAEEDTLRIEFMETQSRRAEDRLAAKAKLIEMGPSILPRVLEQIRHERYAKNRYNAVLLEVLGTLGGGEAYLFSIRENIVQASACIGPLSNLGDDGLPTLLKLLESEEPFARRKTAQLLQTPEYSAFTTEFVVLLGRKLVDSREIPSMAVRELQQDAAMKLIDIVRLHAYSDPSAQHVLFQAAADQQQADGVRIAALKALAKLGPLAASGSEELRALVGYESGRVYNELLTTLAHIEL